MTFRTEVSWSDPRREPLSRSRLNELLEAGMPPEVVRDDLTIDADALEASGWGFINEAGSILMNRQGGDRLG